MHIRRLGWGVATAGLCLALPLPAAAGVASGWLDFNAGYYFATGSGTISQTGSSFTYSGSLSTAFLTNQLLKFGSSGVPADVPSSFSYTLSQGTASAGIRVRSWPMSSEWILSADVVASSTSPSDYGRARGTFSFVNTGIRLSDVAPGSEFRVTAELVAPWAEAFLTDGRHTVSAWAWVDYQYTLVSLDDPSWSAPVFKGAAAAALSFGPGDLPYGQSWIGDAYSGYPYPYSATYVLPGGGDYQLIAEVSGRVGAEQWPVPESELGVVPILVIAALVALKARRSFAHG